MRAGISTTEADPAALLERVLASPRHDRRRPGPRGQPPPSPTWSRPPAGTPVRFRVAAVDLGIKASHPALHGRAGLRGARCCPRPATARADPGGPARTGCSSPTGPATRPRLDYAVEAMRGVLEAGPAGVRHLPGQPDPGPGPRPGHLQAAVRPPRREPAGPGPAHRPGEITSHNHGFAVAMPGAAAMRPDAGQAGCAEPVHPQPRVRAAAERHPRQPQRRRGRGPAAAGRARPSAVQYHPEAAPGPHDATGLFAEFCDLMEAGPGRRA